ncbi:MAG: AAA domain-containing protein, partial [Chitinophagaceae bacterium]
MEYFKRLQQLLQVEKEEDRRTYEQATATLPVAERRAAGMSWYPVAIKDTEIGYADYLTVEVERTTHHDVIHNFRFGQTAALFSQHNADADRVEGTITHISGHKLRLQLRTDSLPDWSRNGKLGVDIVFDEASYAEMEAALKQAPFLADKKEEGQLIQILTGSKKPSFYTAENVPALPTLNDVQKEAVEKILAANDLAIVHGPPGTGKTTTLVQAIKALRQQDRQTILVVAPSNAAVDLLSEKLTDEGLNVVRVGNPARVTERLMSLTLDHKISSHSSAREIKKLKKQAAEYKELAHKYKRSFGPQEREQRKALFAEARSIGREVERIEKYIVDDTLSRADVITATLVGANHYTVRHLKFKTIVIDEAAQAIEPACWIPILKAKRVVMAGDHQQLPPTIKSTEAARGGLSQTLMEKCVALHSEAVVLLQVQYRMHQAIMNFSSQEFYNNRLQAHNSVAEHLLFPGDKPLHFIDTAGCGFEEKLEGTSISNSEEAHFLVKQLEHFVDVLHPFYTGKPFPSIGIISPYKHQVEILKDGVQQSSVLQSVAASITVNTIDSFQGQERD